MPAGPNGGGILPIVRVVSIAATPLESQRLGDRAGAALIEYVGRLQRENGIAEAERIRLVPLNRAGQTELIGPRGKMLPVAVFLGVLFAFVSLAFLLENLRPRPRPAVQLRTDARAADPAARAVS
jgi:hypothetical protein